MLEAQILEPMRTKESKLALQADRDAMMHRAGFVTPVDEKFAAFFKGWQHRRANTDNLDAEIILPSGRVYTLGEGFLFHLRKEVKAAILRLHGRGE